MEEVWKDIEGYEDSYQVSNLGRIKSLIGFNGHKYVKRERILNPYKQKSGGDYFRSVVKLQRLKVTKDYKVHQLVAKAFIPNPNNMTIINHIDGNPLNNRVENLEWCTQKDNLKHATDMSLSVKAIHTIDRETLVDLLNSGYIYDEIAEMLGISKGTVFNYTKIFKIKKRYE